MRILHLGVIDQPYSNKPQPARLARAGKGSRRRLLPIKISAQAPLSTGDVATILEEKYHIMEVFADELTGKDAIQKAIDHSIEGSIESILMGAPAEDLDITGEATSEIEEAFKIAISQQAFDGMIPGVATKASLAGVNHRLKHPYAKDNPPRPSFKDTGLYQANFKAWMDRNE